MSGTFDDDGAIDPDLGVITVSIGKKRSGKSVMSLLLFSQYPHDKLVINTNLDDGPTGPDVVMLPHPTLEEVEDGVPRFAPVAWPEDRRRHDRHDRPLPMTCCYQPDAGRRYALYEIDEYVGLVLAHGQTTGHCGILVHEARLVFPAGRVPGNAKRLLNHNRHNNVTGFFAGPRPVTVDPLLLAQADLVYCFELPNPRDRRRVAEEIGTPPGDFDAAVHALGPHEYLRFDANETKPADGQPDIRLVHFDRLPDWVKDRVQRYAKTGAPVHLGRFQNEGEPVATTHEELRHAPAS